MKRKTIFHLLTITLLSFLLTGCGSSQNNTPEASVSQSQISDNEIAEAEEETNSAENVSDNATGNSRNMPEPKSFRVGEIKEVKFSSYDLATEYSPETDTILLFQENNVDIAGEGAFVENDQVIIRQGGTYILEGNLSDGQLLINAGSDEKIHLIFNGVSLYSGHTAPIYIVNADKVIITLAEGTQNKISDYYLYDNETANACVYSECDLTINGSGSLEVISNFNNGIATKDDLKIAGGDITVTAANNGLKGKDSISIIGGTITVNSKDDGIKSDNEKSEDKGFIYIGGGTVHVSAGDDSLQAVTGILLENCRVYSRCYGKQINCDKWVSGEELMQEWM